jgi:hypothetical protein
MVHRQTRSSRKPLDANPKTLEIIGEPTLQSKGEKFAEARTDLYASASTIGTTNHASCGPWAGLGGTSLGDPRHGGTHRPAQRRSEEGIGTLGPGLGVPACPDPQRAVSRDF